ncbi:periplasmic heavy metal sensor [Trinickia fusca]|uniref:Periplasmic heavy metal sensor n=1 Tax=Trinickia fusca TaxID=2419777 RepID=A0A494XRY9_9BURK|nr:periplasmic heavy metal sensor [Trinickia fusca]RKP50894.1 periplasmic heavy metal sensor [Trinickia fusca]
MTSRTFHVVLIASLVLNVFLLGAIAGGAYRWFADHRAPLGLLAEQAQSHALRDAAQDLSPARQQQFLDALKHARRDARPLAQAGREGRRDVLGIIAAPQFDRAGLDAALTQTRDADRAARAHVEAAVADFVATLTPAERVTFAQSLKAYGQWRELSPPLARAAH